MASKDLVFRFLATDSGAGHEFDRMAGKASSAHKAFSALAAGVAAAGVSVGVASVEMADKFENAHNRLVSALLNTGQSVKGTAVPIAAANKTLESLGFNSAQTADAMAKLELATKNPAKSIKDLSLAADIARGRNIDLATASDLLVKVETGHVGLLGRLGIATKDATGHTISQKEAVRRLTQLYGGDAARFTDTLTGKQKVLGAEVFNMGVKLGLVLIPALLKTATVIETDVIPKLDKFGGWVSRNKTPIEDIAKVLGTIAAFKFASNKLNDVSRLLGFGSKGLVGVGGGILGSAKPIPVYVTNWKGQGGPGGGPLSTAEKDAAKYGPGAAAGATWLTRAAKVARVATDVGALADPMLLPVLTNTQDNGPQGNKKLDAEIVRLLNQFAIKKGVVYGPAGVAVAGDVSRMVTLGKVNQMAANVSDKEMSSFHIASVNGATVPGTKAAKLEIDKLNAALTDEWLNTKKIGRASAENIRLGREAAVAGKRDLAALTRQAQAAGLTIGQALDAGITVGIRQGKGNIDFVTVQIIDGIRHVANKHAQISSPSKMTAYIGEMLAAGLALGLRTGKKGVGQATSDMMNTVLGTVVGAASLGNISSMPDTLGAMGGGTSMAQILAFTHGQRVGDRTFARNLAIARKHGLSKSEAQQIAQLGPDQGGSLAASIAGASRSQIRRLNADEAAIGRYGRQIGGEVSLSDTTIAKLGRAIRPHVSVTTPAQLDRHNGMKILAHR